MLTEKNVIHSKNIVLLLIFCVCYVVSSVLNIRYGIIENVKSLAILAIFFFSLYPYGQKRDVSLYERDFTYVFITYNAIIGVFVALSILMYMFDVGYVVDYLEASSQGFSHEFMRLWGVFTEANCAAIYTAVGFVTSVWLYGKSTKKWQKILLIILCIFDYIFIVLTISHTAQLVLSICTYWVFMCRFWLTNKNDKFVKNQLRIYSPISYLNDEEELLKSLIDLMPTSIQ